MTESVFSDVPDLYDHEMVQIRTVWGALQRKYARETDMASDTVQQRFIREAQGVFAENGFDVHVEVAWMDPPQVNPKTGEIEIGASSPTVSDSPDDWNLYYLPRVKIKGRVDHLKEFDHDRQKHEIRSGMLDGKTGVIDPNTGEMKEDSKKQVIV